MDESNDCIFYKKELHPFSNFWAASIVIDGKIWPTSEHYFQAMKYLGENDVFVESIRKADSPGLAYNLSWSSGIPIRKDWDDVRNKFMKEALLAKFTQHYTLRENLKNTRCKNIIQRCNRDNYWGDGYPGNGKNMLGKLLMEVRSELK